MFSGHLPPMEPPQMGPAQTVRCCTITMQQTKAHVTQRTLKDFADEFLGF